ncbi:MAG: four helix bundle protein [Zunongwangia sp.]|uniref:S23 ribosomal protein n=3 Tax=Zunongwangia profunda TaxID=398743 RepID=D5BCR4_ZUNPS|nr:four helix bundle protein [Zunongwangia profunda]MAC63865.1 four helix bundle protein [Flavobacteriaceae bacterium]MAO37616.1 four helix bundle protein [Zunongwangia sp.]ADF50577.1 S23 ribosomal protein [Zunongwangia profunda SM-A87]MAG86252.1 four helix bundle protein [Flavobacteriaceae bacterium]MAS69935.1 four helix bundle protein [Zunongwangia sp.]
MATIKQFEDLEIWQKAREICRIVYETKKNTNLKNDFKLYNQLNGSSGSIMDNIAEGFERNGNREFIQFLSIAKASCGETRSQLYRAFDRGYLNDDDFEDFKTKVISLSRQINGFIDYLQKSDFKGTKFK